MVSADLTTLIMALRRLYSDERLLAIASSIKEESVTEVPMAVEAVVNHLANGGSMQFFESHYCPSMPEYKSDYSEEELQYL